MRTWMDGWDWAWTTVMMATWVVVVAAPVYVAAGLANRPGDRGTS